jgi:hypothetical protein
LVYTNFELSKAFKTNEKNLDGWGRFFFVEKASKRCKNQETSTKASKLYKSEDLKLILGLCPGFKPEIYSQIHSPLLGVKVDEGTG